MLSEKTKELKDYYGYQKQSYINYEKPHNIKLRKKFVLEYCDDEKKLEKLGKIENGLEIDDVYHQITFVEDLSTEWDSFDGIALANYVGMIFRKDITDVKLYEQIFSEDVMLQERWIEFPSTFYNALRSIINKELADECNKLRREIDELKTANEQMQKFIGHYKLDKVLSDFKTA